MVPVLVAAAWMPLHHRLPNVDVALLLVLVVTAWGLTGRRAAVVVAALAAAGGFAFFDTAPYERWVVSRQPDVETLAVLGVVGLVTGELAVRLRRARTASTGPVTDMGRIREVAGLVASGEELVAVIGAVASELSRMLRAGGCTYEAGEPKAGAVVIGPDGVPDWPADRDRPLPPALVAVPVNGSGRTLGHFLVDAPTAPLSPARLIVALTLADQVGAALIAQAPESAADQGRAPLHPTLRVLD